MKWLYLTTLLIILILTAGCFGWSPYGGMTQEDEQTDAPFGDNTKEKP